MEREELERRADEFARGRWVELLAEASRHATQSGGVRRHADTDLTRRGELAHASVKIGEVSRARQCLVGASLAPRTEETRNELQSKRPTAQVCHLRLGP